MSDSSRHPPFRVALFLDSEHWPAWAAQLLEACESRANVEVVGVLIAADRRMVGEAERVAPRLRNGMFGRRLRGRVGQVYRKLVDRNRVFKNAWAPAESDAIADRQMIRLETTFSPTLREQLAALQLDVVIHCGLRAVPAEVIGCARHGVWSLLGCPADLAQANPAGFWPAMAGDTLTQSMLSVTFADRAPVVLAQSWMATSRYSTRDNVSRHYWKMLFAIPRGLERMHALGPNAYFAECRARVDQSLLRHHSAGQPGIGRHAAYVARAVLSKAINLVDTNLFEQRWRLRQAAPFVMAGETRLGEIQHNPDHCYRADPFVHIHGEQRLLFFEEYCDRRALGHLSVVSLDSSGRPNGDVRTILQRPYHLSYPQVFEWEGEHLMLPETSGNRTVELYRATRFPDEWVLHSVLMEDIDASDATLHRKDGLWWLFANVKSHPAVSSQDECYLYFAEALTGPWTAHPLNPVVSDCRTSRPGGAMLEIDGRLIRPTQDCTYRYGYGLNFMEVTTLTTTDYAEVLLEHLPPDGAAGAIGMHSYAEADGFAYVDELYRSPRWKHRKP